MKKVLALSLATALSLSLFAGCSGKQSSSGSSAAAGDAKPTKVVFAMVCYNTVPPANTVQTVSSEVNRYIKEKYPKVNVQLEYKLIGAADYDKKINLMLQSGEQLDIYRPSNIANAIATNQLQPIDDALKANGKEMVDILKKYCGETAFAPVTQNGKIMAVPANKNMALTPLLTYDKAMLAATGYTDKDITDLASLEPIFKKIKQLYPNVYPFVSTDLSNKNLPYYLYAKNKIDTIGNDFGGVVGNSNKVVNIFETQDFRDACVMMKRWHDNGWMPKDLATGTLTGNDYIKAKRGFCTYASYSANFDYSEFEGILSNKFGTKIGAKPISSSYMTTDFASDALGIPTKSKAANAAVQLLNILYTDEYAYNTLLWGMKDRDYVKATDNTVKYPKGLNDSNVPYNAAMSSGKFGSNILAWQTETGQTDQQKQAKKDFWLKVNNEAPHSPYYGFRFNAAPVKTELTVLNNVYQQYYYPLICGSVDIDSTIKKFNSELNAAGLQKVMTEKQTQLDKWLAAKK